MPTYAPDGRGWLFVADALALVGSTLLVLAVHRPLGIALDLTPAALTSHVLLLACFDALLILRLGLAGQYEEGRRFSRIDDITVVIRAAFMAAAVAVFIAVLSKGFFLEFESYSRAFLGIACGVPVVLLSASRIAAHGRQVRAFADGRYLVRSLVIGEGERAARFVDRLTNEKNIGYLGRRSEVPVGSSVGQYMPLFAEELTEFAPDEVILAFDEARPDLRAAIVREAAYRNVAVKVLPDVFESFYDMPVSEYDGVPVTTVFQTPGDKFARRLKRFVDMVGSWLGILVLLPFLGLVALLIWIEDRGPVFFSQERVGERGKRFMVHKFRTMHLDAEARMLEVRHLNEADGPIFKMRDDPRVTRVGRYLRRFSIDEFPQLLNVARGQMSLIGPRPPLPSEVDEYRLEHRRRLMVPPGMTGLWQVSGRSDTTFDEMVELDLMYIENWSFWLDARVLLRTVWVVLFSRGAY